MNDALLSAIGGVIGGGAVAALLTGVLTIRQKKIARRQKRRSLAYAEAITWMKLVMTAYLASQAGVGVTDVGQVGVGPAGVGPAGAGLGQGGPPADAAERFISPVTSATFPFHVPAASTDIGLGSSYLAAVRAQVITFGTHDMARAFDRWVDAFAEVLRYGEGCRCVRLDPKLETSKTSAALRTMTCYDAIFPKVGELTVPGTTNPVHRWKRDVPDGLAGCLTRAVENCASWELRHG